MASLSVRTVSKQFGPTSVLSGVSLEVRSGEFFSLLGPSGCGKSTLLRIIAGLEQADRGSVLIDGKSVDQVAPQRRGVGMVFQQYALWPHMTIGQNVRFGLEGLALSAAERDAKMRRALERVQMETYTQRYPHEISGGQQQRVALARALAMQPRIILLDEPLSNLDARLRIEIRQQLMELRDTLETTMVYVTHDQDDALALSSRIGVIHQGTIQQVGTPREIYQQPASSFVARFIGDANLIPCRIASAEGAESVRARLETVGEPIVFARVHADVAVVPGVLGFLCIRPFSLKVLPAKAAHSAAILEATVRRITYRGADYVLRLEGTGGQFLHASTHERELTDDLQVGNRVSVSWEQRDSVFIPA